jgi:hypothetical protein
MISVLGSDLLPREKIFGVPKYWFISTPTLSLSLVYYRQDCNSRIHCEDYLYLGPLNTGQHGKDIPH